MDKEEELRQGIKDSIAYDDGMARIARILVSYSELRRMINGHHCVVEPVFLERRMGDGEASHIIP